MRSAASSTASWSGCIAPSVATSRSAEHLFTQPAQACPRFHRLRLMSALASANECGTHEIESRGMRASGIDPDGTGPSPAQSLHRLDQTLGIIGSNVSVVDHMLGTTGLARAPSEAIGKGGSIDVEDKFEEPCVESFGQRLEVLDKRGSGEVLPKYDVVSCAEVFLRDSKAEPPGVRQPQAVGCVQDAVGADQHGQDDSDRNDGKPPSGGALPSCFHEYGLHAACFPCPRLMSGRSARHRTSRGSPRIRR